MFHFEISVLILRYEIDESEPIRRATALGSKLNPGRKGPDLRGNKKPPIQWSLSKTDGVSGGGEVRNGLA
eukprot:3949043-Amphidinium_carterae.1